VAGSPDPNAYTPRFSVVVPSRGEPTKLTPLLASLRNQSLPRDQFEIIVALDGVTPDPQVTEAIAAAGATTRTLESRRGPGAARNAGAAGARGEWLAFTEDDCTPEPTWLEHAAMQLDATLDLDVIEGLTLKPGGQPVRTRSASGRLYLPTNLFVRRALFERLGGYHEGYFDPANGTYFREDADFGFTAEEAGARIVTADDPRVVHPEEHAGVFDPLRWAARYEMDALLAARHPKQFRERIEIHQLGPFRVRRPIVRASIAFLVALAAALGSFVAGQAGLAVLFLGFALIAFLPIWAKWRFDPLRLPIYLLVPFALVAALVRGASRVRAMSVEAIRGGSPR